jgi:hypothetical protein
MILEVGLAPPGMSPGRGALKAAAGSFPTGIVGSYYKAPKRHHVTPLYSDFKGEAVTLELTTKGAAKMVWVSGFWW